MGELIVKARQVALAALLLIGTAAGAHSEELPGAQALPCRPCLSQALSTSKTPTPELSTMPADTLKKELVARARAINPGVLKEGIKSRPSIKAVADPQLAKFSTDEIAKALIAQEKGIYGKDNRLEVFQVPSVIANSKAIMKNADGVVIVVPTRQLSRIGLNTFALRGPTFKEGYELCNSEKFLHQPLCGFCSGFLVAPDLIVTAGHCVAPRHPLSAMRFVFGFRMIDADRARLIIPEADIYKGVEVLDRHDPDWEPAEYKGPPRDWAIVRLDRPVTNHQPVSMRGPGDIMSEESVYVIGHPCGLPQKYAGDGSVRENWASSYFVTNLDAYGGNSGSPVFNAQTHKVEGILVRGGTDFVQVGPCWKSLVCPSSGCLGEHVSRYSDFSAALGKAMRAKPSP